MRVKLSEKDVLTAAKIATYENELQLFREGLTLTKHPFATMRIFIAAASSFTMLCIRSSLSHPLVLFCVLPAIAIWGILEQFEGPYTPYINKIEFGVEFFVWWVGLGILSSIGLGSGLQSGVLFVFPHIIEVCLAAQSCQTVDFAANTNMWFRNPPDLFQCPELTPTATRTTYVKTWMKILPVCFFQAAGTAIGEIPPYWMTRSARLASIQAGLDGGNEALDELESVTPFNSNPNTPLAARSPRTRSKAHTSYSYEKILKKVKTFMIRFLRKHGFFGVLLMASFPNIAFDICGVFCGHYLMPFWTFFIATFVGKAIIRNGIQSFIFVALCSEEYMELLIVTLQQLAPDSLNIDHSIREVLEESRASFHRIHKDNKLDNSGNGTSIGVPSTNPPPSASSSLTATIMYYWQIVMSLILISFLTSCVSQFAQHYQMTIDNEEIGRLRAKLMKQQMYGGDVDDSLTSITPLARTQIPFIQAPSSSQAAPPDHSWATAASPASPWSLMLPEGSHSGHAHDSPEVIRQPEMLFCSSDTPVRKRE